MTPPQAAGAARGITAWWSRLVAHAKAAGAGNTEDPGPPLLTPVVRELTRSEGQPPIEVQIVAAVVTLHNAHLAVATAAVQDPPP